MSNGIPPQRSPLIQVAAPLVTLGGICLGPLGLRLLGIFLISIGALVVVLHLLGRYVSPLRTVIGAAAYAMSSVARRFLADAVDTFKRLSGFPVRVVVIFVVVSFLAGFSGMIGKVFSNIWGNERLALDYVRTADACLIRDDYHCAEEAVEKAKALLPNDIRVLEASMRAHLLQLAIKSVMQNAVVTEDVRRAKADCEFWSARSPHNASLVALLGMASSLLDDPYTAEAQYKKAIDLNTSYANAYNYWGYDLTRWRIHPDWAEMAKEKLEKATALDPKYPMPLLNLSKLVLQTQTQDDPTLTRVEGYLLKTRDASPEDQRVYASLGGFYLAWGDILQDRKVPEEAMRKYVAAHDYLLQGYKLNPHNPYILLHLAEVLSVMQADSKRVIQYLKDAVAEAPDYWEAFADLAEAYDRTGEKIEAKEARDAARKLLGLTIADLEQRRNRLPAGEVRNRLDSWLEDQHRVLTKLDESKSQPRATP